MKPNLITSSAFDRATLSSERYRIAGLIVVLIGLCVLGIGRVVVNPRTGDWMRLMIGLLLMSGAIAFEFLMFAFTTRAWRNNHVFSTWAWTINTILESLMPSLILLMITLDTGFIGPYRALFSPVVLLYGALVILSSLRLKPILCVLSGTVSSIGYLLVYAITRYYFPDEPARFFLPPEAYFMYPIILFGIGLIGAAVARRIRMHVIAALNEAESRQKLELIQHDLKLARSIQMGLLPASPPPVTGYDIAGWNEPADQTGGDYYDWMELPGNRILFTIADATGHGIGPALMIATCRAYFRAVVLHNDPLEKITEQVDALIAADSAGGRFITAAIAILEPDQNLIHLYSAGQAPIFSYTAADHRIQTFEADQPPLGINFGNSGMKARQITLNRGDALVLVTDGFFECRNLNDQMLGIQRLGELVLNSSSESAGRMIEILYESVLRHCEGNPVGDDQTALIIKRM